MKSNWDKTTLEDVCVKITDGAHHSPKSVEDGLPMASVKDLTSYGINLSTCRHISSDDFKKLVHQGCQPESGDVLIAKDGNSALETVCEIKKKLNVVLLSSVAILRPNKNKITSSYLRYFLDCEATRDYLKNGFITGAAIPRVILKDFKRCEIFLPPLSTQKKIASILSAYDDLIENNTRRIKILEEMAQTLYNEWFVKFRFPGYEQVKMVESELGLIPEGWEVRKLGDFIDTQKGFAFKSQWYQDIGIPIVKVSNFTDDSIETRNLVCVPEQIAEKYRKHQLNSNDIIIQTVGSWASNPQSVVGKIIRVPRQAENSLLNQNAVKIIPSLPLNKSFLFYLLKTEEFKSYIIGCAQGAASQASITLDSIKGFSFLLPSLELLNSFHNFTFPIWELINNLRLKNTSLSQTRDLLLPKLISGEIDVENLNIDTIDIAA